MSVAQTSSLAKRPSRRWSLPNILTYLRILAVPAVVLCFYLEAPLSHWLAFAFFVVASITDFFDGYLARRWHQQSRIGRTLDPIADKMLVGGALFMLAATQVISGWSCLAGVIILDREYAVSGLREFLAGLRVKLPVTYLAKGKTVVQMVAIAILLLAPVADEWFDLTIAGNGMVTLVGLFLLWTSAIVTVYTGYSYYAAGSPQLDDEDDEESV